MIFEINIPIINIFNVDVDILKTITIDDFINLIYNGVIIPINKLLIIKNQNTIKSFINDVYFTKNIETAQINLNYLYIDDDILFNDNNILIKETVAVFNYNTDLYNIIQNYNNIRNNVNSYYINLNSKLTKNALNFGYINLVLKYINI